MQSEPDREQFRAWFSDLKEADQHAAPPFDGDWQAALRRSRAPAPRALGYRDLAAAIVLLALLGGSVAFFSHRSPPRTVATNTSSRPQLSSQSGAPEGSGTMAGSIEDWQSPTAFLLELASEESPPPDTGNLPGVKAAGRMF